MNCPDCDAALKDPNRCRCGWARNTDTVHEAICSRCPITATEKHKVDGHWTNFCPRCANELRAEQAREYCASKGLNSLAEIKRWLKDQPLARRIPMRDDQRDEAA